MLEPAREGAGVVLATRKFPDTLVAGALFRADSWANILKKILSDYRMGRPNLPLDAITPEAAVHARDRPGFEPVAGVFRALSDRNPGCKKKCGHTMSTNVPQLLSW